MLYFMSKRLANSSLTSELMEFLVLISQENSFFPVIYLTVYEADRLEFDLKYGCIQNVTIQQKKMINAVLLGFRILCACIIYRPWLIELKNSPLYPN